MTIEDEVYELCRAARRPPEDAPPSGVPAGQIRRAEAEMGITFPEDLRRFLLRVNGPCIGAGGIYGIETVRPNLDVTRAYRRFAAFKTSGWIPIAGDGCGNQYVLVTNASGLVPVCFVDTMESAEQLAYVVGSDLWHFLRFYLMDDVERQGWPFSRDYVVSHDPAIVNCTVAPLPWNS